MGSYTHLDEVAHGTSSAFNQKNQLGSNSSRKRRNDGSSFASGVANDTQTSQFNATFFPSVQAAASGNLNIRKMNGS